MSSFFVTGTDTNVGKTVCSRAIIQALQNVGVQVVGYKPIACRKDEGIYTDFNQQEFSTDNNDVEVLLNSSNQPLNYQDINGYSFQHSMPMLSPDREKIKVEKIDQDLIRLNQQYERVIVEGSFGWLTPMNKDYRFADWAKQHNMPVVLVVGIKEGCINHALLTVQSIRQMGLPLLGWVANRINPGLAHYAEIIDALTENIDAPLLGQIPYLYKPEQQDVGRFITNIEPLQYLYQ